MAATSAPVPFQFRFLERPATLSRSVDPCTGTPGSALGRRYSCRWRLEPTTPTAGDPKHRKRLGHNLDASSRWALPCDEALLEALVAAREARRNAVGARSSEREPGRAWRPSFDSLAVRCYRRFGSVYLDAARVVVSTFKSRRRQQRLAAVIGGLLLLFGQLLGAAHSHRYQLGTNVSATGQATACDSGSCPICLAAFHAPGAVASAPSVICPQSVVQSTVEQPTRPCSSRALASPHGRAPPASV